MTTKKNLGIWMDHSSAHLIEFADPVAEGFDSELTHEEKSLEKDENMMHHREEGQQADYYKKLGETIKNYDEVLLFGPTDAKLELLNILKADHAFSKIKILTKSSEKMTGNQEQAFVKDYFSKPRPDQND